jgi:phenylalanyl-tRNA synthetase beta chain
MKISLNTIKELVDFDLPPIEELIEKINMQLGGVEEVIDLSQKYKGIVVVKIVHCTPVPDSDHLSLTKIDDGGAVQGIDRDENGLVQVVCGAPNVRSGMMAVWIPPGHVVPSTVGDKEPFVIGSKQLRGMMSNGMLASSRELGFGDSHEGILEIEASELSDSQIEIQPGTNFAEAYKLNDYIIDIENKMFTHRPDCFGVLGVAREIAGILGQKFSDPDWYWMLPQFNSAEGISLDVFNETPDNVQRFMAVALKDVKVCQSPLMLQAQLVRLGGKPINNIVDITNYTMLLTGQPTHAYDYDKLRGGSLGVRMTRPGEKVELLNGKTIELHEADIVVVDGEGVVGLGGIMGGRNSEVSEQTSNVVIEVAHFDMYAIRRSSMRHGLFTDASSRFTKGQSKLQTDRVMNYLLQSIQDIAGGEQASAVFDIHKTDTTYETQSLSGPMKIESQFINQRLGMNFDNHQIGKILQNVHFNCNVDDGDSAISVTAPFWRTDIEIPEDIVEEVGRLYGFHHLPHELPYRSITPAPINQKHQFKQKLRSVLSLAGANEVLTYSFVHRNIMEKSHQNVEDAYQLSNALSPDLHYMRQTVLPSLLDKVHMNEKAGYDRFALFEIGKGHQKKLGNDIDGVPKELEFISLVMANGSYYDVKSTLEFLAEKLNISLEYHVVENNNIFESKRSAQIVCAGKTLGTIGEIGAAVRHGFKLPNLTSGFEIDLDLLFEATRLGTKARYRSLSKFPHIERDVTFKVDESLPYAHLINVVHDTLQSTNLNFEIGPGTIFQADSSSSKNVTLHVRLTSLDKTLTSDEANEVIAKVTEHAQSVVGATAV